MTDPNKDAQAERPIEWVKAAKKDFAKFPKAAQRRISIALGLAAEGRKADIAKPMHSLGAGVFEIALKYRTDAYRTIYALKLDDKIWVVHAFMKKSKSGTKTPQQDLEKIKTRIKSIKEMLSDD